MHRGQHDAAVRSIARRLATTYILPALAVRATGGQANGSPLAIPFAGGLLLGRFQAEPKRRPLAHRPSGRPANETQYPLRVADRGRLPLAPERAHLGPVIHMSVGDDRACGLDELPMPEHIGQRSAGMAASRASAASQRRSRVPKLSAPSPSQ
jgi:hypothetical protein